MSGKLKAPRGTFDVLPEEGPGRARIERAASEICARAGYERISTPIFEESDLFSRGVGTSTDIVRKEMFTFEDKGGRSLTLRPEGTAPICRSYIEHGMHKRPQPVKLFYSGSFFRHERPQAGRHRQFSQIGVEAIGTDSPLADVEVITLLRDLLEELGVPGYEIHLGSLGSLEARAAYLDELKSHLRSRSDELSEEVRERIEINPLRAFDSDHAGTAAVMASAPRLLDHLDEADSEHFEQVRSLLEAAGVPFVIDTGLVRGLDYYTRTIFSVVCDRLGAVSELGGGGRYDGLIGQLGGPDTPAIGWAAGVERILLALDEPPAPSERDLYIALADPGQRPKALALVTELRHSGFTVELELTGRSLKGQLKQADRVGARRTLILDGDAEPVLRDMSSGEQGPVDTDTLVSVLRA